MATEDNLFVDPEADSDVSNTDVEMAGEMELQYESSDEEIMEQRDEDPVVESIPLVMNTVPDRVKNSIHLLQYQGKSNKSPFPLKHLEAGVKPESNFVQVSVPLDTSKFYDESKVEEWGHIEEHKHTGVLNKTNGGIYAAKCIVRDGQKKIILIPIDSSAQLRPTFKYMDDAENQKLQQRKEFNEPKQTQSNVHILQSTAKANSKATTNDPLSNAALGESLRHVRKFEQEEWTKVNWDETNENNVLFDKLDTTESIKLHTKTTMDNYLDVLTK